MTNKAMSVVLICAGLSILLLVGISGHRFMLRAPAQTQMPVSGTPLTTTGDILYGDTTRMADMLKPCPEEAHSAALDQLYPTLGNINKESAKSLDSAEKSIACFRPWAEGLADNCQKKAVLEWLEYYEKDIREARQALAEGRAQSDQAKWENEQQERRRKIRNYTKAHPFPKMPQCESK